MTGRLQNDFRSGNLAEDLGLLLLKGIAAVAEVPRQEDIGLDAIATLLRRDEDGNSYAEDSFVVQLKSESAAKVEYRDHGLEWLVGQSQPMFIGRVSLADSRISIYPTLSVNHSVLALHAKSVTVRFGISNVPSFLPGQWSRWVGGDNGSAKVWLGEPLLRWTLADLVDREWASRAYETLKRFLAVARRELQVISLGQCSVIEWSTNDASSIKATLALMKGQPDDLVDIAAQCIPFIHALMSRLSTKHDDVSSSLMARLIALTGVLREMGIGTEAEHQFGSFLTTAHVASSSDSGTA